MSPLRPEKGAASENGRKQVQRYALTNQLLSEARQARDQKEERQWPIDHPRGLFIRARHGECAYYVQARAGDAVIKRKICLISEITIAEIKQLAAEVITTIKNGHDPDVAIAARLKGDDEAAVGVALDRADAAKNDLWTFAQTIDQYTDRKVTRDGISKHRLAPPSIREIQDRLRDRPEAKRLMNRYVQELRLEDFEKIRDEIFANGNGDSGHAKFVDLSKRILRRAARHRRLQVALNPTEPWWEALSHEHALGNRSNRYLSPDQVGMLIALLEAVRPLEMRATDSVLGAMQAGWMIAQRSAALVGMQSIGSVSWQSDPAPERKGWRVYTWRADDVKAKRQVKLSIPPVAIEIFERVAQNTFCVTSVKSRWAFPQIRNKYLARAHAESSEKTEKWDKHITASALNHTLDALGGRKPGWPNLLSIVGLPDRIGPHDSRRSVSSFFENTGEGAYASALLDHKVSGQDKMSRQVAAITQGVYSAADRVIFKAEGLLLWLGAVLPAYEKAKNDPRLVKAIEARKSSLEKTRAIGLVKRKRTLAAKYSGHRNRRIGLRRDATAH
jgi:hypothetical protein